MDGSATTNKSNIAVKIVILLIYYSFMGLILLFSFGWGIFLLIYGFLLIIVVEMVFGYSFAKLGLFKNAPIGIILLMPFSMIVPISYMTFGHMTEGGVKVCMDGCSVEPFWEHTRLLFVWYLIVWIIVNIPMVIAYLLTLKNAKKADEAKQEAILEMQQEAAIKAVVEEKALEDLLKNRSENPVENPTANSVENPTANFGENPTGNSSENA